MYNPALERQYQTFIAELHQLHSQLRTQAAKINSLLEIAYNWYVIQYTNNKPEKTRVFRWLYMIRMHWSSETALEAGARCQTGSKR